MGVSSAGRGLMLLRSVDVSQHRQIGHVVHQQTGDAYVECLLVAVEAHHFQAVIGEQHKHRRYEVLAKGLTVDAAEEIGFRPATGSISIEQIEPDSGVARGAAIWRHQNIGDQEIVAAGYALAADKGGLPSGVRQVIKMSAPAATPAELT